MERSERARVGVAISGIVLVLVGVFVATAITFSGDRAGDTRALGGSLTIRPNRFNRTVVPIILYALTGVSLVVGYHVVVYPGTNDTSLDSAGAAVAIAVLAVCCVGVAIIAPKAYIRVDQSTITFGPSLTASAARRNSFDRREVVRLRAAPMSRTILFLRSDGSTLTSASGHFWDRDGLQRLAGFLSVPLES